MNLLRVLLAFEVELEVLSEVMLDEEDDRDEERMAARLRMAVGDMWKAAGKTGDKERETEAN